MKKYAYCNEINPLTRLRHAGAADQRGRRRGRARPGDDSDHIPQGARCAATIASWLTRTTRCVCAIRISPD